MNNLYLCVTFWDASSLLKSVISQHQPMFRISYKDSCCKDAVFANIKTKTTAKKKAHLLATGTVRITAVRSVGEIG